ncbi:MAG: hypothetical protein ACKVOM_02230 [Ferruginibacter sp.]
MEEQEYNKEEARTYRQSLDLINEMISKAKKSYTTKGIASMVWGSLITFCGVVNWVEIHFNKDFGDVWLLTLIALLPQIYFSVKEKRSKNFIAHNEITTNYIWIAFTLSMFITSYHFSYFNLGNVSSLIMMLFGIPTFIIGGMNKFKPMIVGGIFCWAASIVSIFTNIEIDLLLIAACGLFAWLVPGIILWGRYKKSVAANV